MTYLAHQLTTDGGIEASQKRSDAETAHISAKQNLLDRYSLAAKIRGAVFANALVLAVTSIAILGCFAYFSSAGTALGNAAVLEISATQATIELNEAERALVAYQDEPSSDRFEALQHSLDEAQNQIAYANDWLDEDTSAATLETIGRAHARLERTEAELALLGMMPDANSPGLAPLLVTIRELRTDLTGISRATRGQLAPASRDLFAGLGIAIGVALILLIAAFLASVLISRAVTRNVVETVRSISAAMTDISRGQADMTIPGRERADEIGEMARALTVFRDKSQQLRALNERRRAEAEQQLAQQQALSQRMGELRREKSELLEELARGFELSVGELITAVSAASQQLLATSTRMVNLAQGSEDQAASATAAMGKASTNVTAAAAATDEFALSITEISSQASSSASLARDAASLVDTANTRMNDLSLAAEEIGEIAGLIQTIAQRTNLLALNASIEAARGGEAGRGFAVVASEVKELAMQTSNATSSVAQRIAAMQATTRSSAADLTSIVEQIGEVERAAVMIASAVDQQSVSAAELARNIDTVAQGSGDVGLRLSELDKAARETGEAASEVVDSVSALDRYTADLKIKAGRFIADVRRSAQELEAGGDGARQTA